MLNAYNRANHVLEEMCEVHLDLIDHGLRIADEYRLHMSDIKWPPPAQENILHTRITRIIGFQDDSPEPPGDQLGSLIPEKTEAARLLDRLLDMVTLLDPHIGILFTEKHNLIRILFPPSMWSHCRSILTGRCSPDDQTTADLINRWALDSVGQGSEFNWAGAIKRAKDLVAEAAGFVAADLTGLTSEVYNNGVMQQPGADISEVTDVGEVSAADSGNFNDPSEQGVTATGSVVNGGGKSTRRRKKKERGYLIGSQGQWQ